MRKIYFSLLAAVISPLAVTAASSAATYQYDALGRLTAVVHDNGSRTDYAYDANGNRVTATVDIDPPQPPAPPTVIVVPLNGFSVIPLYDD